MIIPVSKLREELRVAEETKESLPREYEIKIDGLKEQMSEIALRWRETDSEVTRNRRTENRSFRMLKASFDAQRIRECTFGQLLQLRVTNSFHYIVPGGRSWFGGG